ncbi:MAG TPA: flagellin [Alphaproteobacteria bacterium]|jgi:flagellin|nr:flagellin [Micavibrio sp.]MBP7721241.1 flagellin [Alphaproteobacteria bacterium]HQX26925.1 flagellin [Alphaproteobacteria bacterium]
MASTDVVLSAALRNNLLSLQSTQRLIDSVQLRLATGLKINSALDGAQKFFTSQSLSNRASDLGRLLDGINLSIRTIEEANTGVTAVSALVEQAQAIAEDAKSATLAASGFAQIKSSKNLNTTGALVAASGGTIAVGDDITISVVRANGTVVTSAANVVNFAAADTIYNVAGYINADAAINPYVQATVDANGRLTLTSKEVGASIRIQDGTTSLGADGYAFLGLETFVGTEETVAGTRQGGTAIAGRTLYSQLTNGVATNGLYNSSDTLGAQAGFLDNAGADSIQVILNIDGVITTTTAALLDTNTIQDLIDDINNNATVNTKVVASFNRTTGRIELEFADSVGYVDLQFQANAASTIDFGFSGSQSVVAAAVIPTDVVLGAAGNDISERFNFSGSNADVTQFQDDFNTIRGQIDSLVEDANIRGVNLLQGDTLTTFFNEDRTNTLATVGSDLSAAGLGIKVANFSNTANVQLSIDATITALDTVRNFGTTIANSLSIIQTRRDFTESTISILKAGAADLVTADQNEEGANLLALQTRQQLGVTALSLAAQSQQSVLRLF